MLKEELTDSRENTDKQQNSILRDSIKSGLNAPAGHTRIKNATNRVAFFVGIVLASFIALALSGCKADKVVAGQKAPDIRFLLQDGSVQTLSSLLPYPNGTLLVFWSTWCDVCKAELPALNTLAEQSDIRVIAIAIRDQKDKWGDYLQQNKFSHIVNGFADTKAVLDSYKGDGVPESFFIDPNGNFQLVTDRNGQKVVRMIGNQPWEAPAFNQQFLLQ